MQILFSQTILTVQHFGYIILTFTTQFLILLYSHYNEFMFRLAFSYMTYNLKLKDIIKEYIPHSFLALSLNIRNNQFQLEFQNQISITNLNVEDNKTLIEMMRNTFVVPKGYNSNLFYYITAHLHNLLNFYFSIFQFNYYQQI